MTLGWEWAGLHPTVLVLWPIFLWWQWRLDARHGWAARVRLWALMPRALAAAVLLLFLIEPALVWRQRLWRPPRVLVLWDLSVSMQLAQDELPADLLLDAVAALGTPLPQRDLRAQTLARALATLDRALMLWRGLGDGQAATAALADDSAALAADARRLPLDAAQRRCIDAVLADLQALLAQPAPELWEAYRRSQDAAQEALAEVQRRADRSALNARDEDDPVLQAVRRVAAGSRHERVRAFLQQVWTPALEGVFEWDLRAMDPGLDEIAPAQAPATGTRSDLAGTLRAISQELGRGAWEAVILISDGRATVPGDSAAYLRGLLARGVRVYPVVVGSPALPQDPSLAAISLPSDAYRDELVRVVVRYRVPPTAAAGGWELVLTRDGVECGRRRLPASREWQEQVFHCRPSGLGLNLFSAHLHATQAPAPDLCPDNNRVQAAVHIHGEPLRILLLDASPRWESRCIAAVARADDRMQIVERYALARPTPAPLLALDEDLTAYDVIVLGDLGRHQLDADRWLRLRQFVERDGGLLVVVAGQRAMPLAHRFGVLAELLPQRIAHAVLGESTPDQHLVDVGDPLVRVLPDRALNHGLWARMPAPSWQLIDAPAKPAARVLLARSDEQPLLASQRIGAGEVVLLGSDETWAWRARLGGGVQAQLWRQLLRRGGESVFSGQTPDLQIALQRPLCAVGEAVAVRILARAGPPQVTLRDAADRAWPQSEVTDEGPDRYRVVLTPQGHGRHQVVVRDARGATEERQLLVQAPGRQELVDLQADHARMAALATQAGVPLRHVLRFPAWWPALAQRHGARLVLSEDRLSIWDRAGSLLALLTAFLVADWWWRRRLGAP